MTDRVHAGTLEIGVPDGWQVLHAPQTDIVLTEPPRTSGFTTNIVVTSWESADSMVTVASRAMATASVQHPGAQVISDDVVVVDGRTGRAIVLTYPHGIDDQVVAYEFLFRTGARAVQIVASCPIVAFPAAAEGIRGIVHGIRFVEENQ